MWGGDVGLLAAISSTSALTADDVPWSGLHDGRGSGLGDDPHGRWMVIWDLMLGPEKDPVFNHPNLWDMAEVLLERSRVYFGGNDDNHLRVRSHCGRQASRWRRWWSLKTLTLLRLLQRLWRKWIFRVCPALFQGPS